MLMLMLFSCTPYRKMQKIRQGKVAIGLSVPEDKIEEDQVEEVIIDSIRGTLTDGPIIMNAIRDSETGEMVATDVINASKVTARFRNVAERDGYVSIGFDVTVPETMSESRWRLRISPQMRIQEDTVMLDPVYITGIGYREQQLRGYQRYRNFLSSILTDTTDMVRVRQLEIFLQRYFPETYAMKTDTSLVSEPMAENLFGVSQKEALRHYTMHWKVRRNEWKKSNRERMFRRYVRDPIVMEGIRLDTVLVSEEAFVYRYVHTFRSRPGLKKVLLTLEGSLYERGECIARLPFPEELTFYISTLSTLADMRPKYRMMVLERKVYDNTKAFIDFRQGSDRIDTLLGDNASEMRRIRKCIDDVVAREEYVLDSLVIVASCSLEGAYQLNSRLSKSRSDAVKQYIGQFVPDDWKGSLKTSALPENWNQFRLLVKNDSVLKPETIKRILQIAEDHVRPDESERRLARLPEYRYLREKVYPKLRSVSFDFHLHRAGMVKDTIHTTELDTLYMEGVQAMKEMDYKKAVLILRPYDDYNSALAFMSAGYNHSALDVMGRLDISDPKVCYLMALVLSRLERFDEAMKYFELCLMYDPYMEYRANLDPEMAEIVRLRNKKGI
jgi:hypothetical protein